jgi:uncharacterized phiE125 gp8 family phage protein
MEFRIKRTVQPSVEPVTTSELKAHLKLTGSAEDGYLANVITAARQMLEDYTQSAWCLTAFELSLPTFVDYVELPYSAVNTTVTSISYKDSDGVANTINNTNYQVVSDVSPSVVKFKSSFTIPSIELFAGFPIKVTYTTGHATAATVPMKYKQAVLIYASSLYENREGEGKTAIPMSCRTLLNSERLFSSIAYVGIK